MAKPSISVVCIALLGFTGEAHAYLDPGTGSMLLQAVIGSVAAGLVVGKLYWHRLKGFFLRNGAKEGLSDEDPSAK